MDINNARKRQTQSRAVDGFFFKSPASTSRPAAVPASRIRHTQTSARPGAQSARTVQDFKRADGFHPAPRRTVQRQPLPVTHTIGAQFADQPIQKQRRFGRKAKPKTPVSRFRRVMRWTFRATAIMLVILLAVGGLLFGKGYFKLKKVFNGSTTAAALKTDVDPTLLKGEGDGRVNILMLGVGGANHDGGDLTDTIMIASVDPINNQATLLSIPRDLWVKMPNNYISNYQKINAAYESGKYKYIGKQDITNANSKAVQAGFAAADSTVENVIGIPIHYNVLVDFQAFKQAVDTVGGVDINVPEQLYDPTMAWENHWNPVLAQAGPQTMDGTKALMYVRSRETSSDFARSQRQRAVLVALKDKITGLGTLTNPVKLSNLLSAFGNNVQSDIGLNDMTRMASIMKKIPSDQIQSIGLADAGNSYVTTGNINGLSVVEPKAGLEDYSAIQAYVRSKLKDGYIAKENARVTVLNGTVTPGLATDKSTSLKSYGYNVGTVADAPTSDYTDTEIIDLSHGAKKYTVNYLKNRFHVSTVKTVLPTGLSQGDADIVIILGTDAASSTEN